MSSGFESVFCLLLQLFAAGTWYLLFLRPFPDTLADGVGVKVKLLTVFVDLDMRELGNSEGEPTIRPLWGVRNEQRDRTHWHFNFVFSDT